MLKQLKLQLELKQLRQQLEQLETHKKNFEQRSAELEIAAKEATSQEDYDVLEKSIDDLAGEMEEADTDGKIQGIKGQIGKLEEDQEILGKKQQAAAENTIGETEQKGEEKERGANMHKLQVRKMLESGEYYERAEVKEFYEQFKHLRSITGSELTVPNIIINRISDILGDYCTLYPLVDKVQASGTVRILIDGDTTAATWIEMTAPIPEGDVGTITNIDFDGFKVGKVTFVDNAILKDSIINLDNYVTKKIARSIALALDKAILNGKGAASKQPEGILTKLSDSQKVIVENPKGYDDIVKHIGKIDTGEDSVGEIISIMHRKTYYNKILTYSVQPTAAGNVVGKLPNLGQPDLLGLRVVFSNCMEEDNILFGDFSKYTLIERESISVDSSEHVKFTQDQMTFRGKARFDGKPVNAKAFVLVTLTESVAKTEPSA